jgi:ATP phosphoribosyltransferase regulatory subunit
MSLSNRWLLPDGVDELLPPEAWALENMRRAMLDTYASFGYELVTPPLIEFIESLLTGTGNNLDIQTFKVTDQLTGRMMGVRADITPQAARIDAHLLKTQDVSRLCYVDTVLHTRPAHMMTNRTPLQIGCELFGEKDVAADLEVVSLMLKTLEHAGIRSVHIDLAHAGIYRSLIAAASLPVDMEARVFDALKRKSIPELDSLASGQYAAVVSIIRDIAQLSGSVEALDDIKASIELSSEFSGLETLAAIEELKYFAEQIIKRFPQVDLGYDFCELRGYDYHTGIMFSAYTPGFGYALAKGGRYDSIGKDFGSSRPATGFTADLKTLVRLGQQDGIQRDAGVLAPSGDGVDLLEAIDQLRSNQRRVVQCLNADDSSHYNCTQQLVFESGAWQVRDF